MSEAPSNVAEGHLLDNVRPPDWRNPTPRERYDLVVVGAGTGGLVSAAIGAALGARVALVERRRMGGDCLNFGCVPSKGMLRAARSWAAARSSHESFGGPPVSGSGDFTAAMAGMREIRAGISDVDAAERFSGMGVDVFFGEGRFDSRRSLLIDGRDRLEFRRAIIATGTRPTVPDVPGLDGSDFLTNENVFDLDRRPDRLLVLGAGAIGCELSQAFARLGSAVVLLDLENRVLAREEADAAELVLAALRRDGVEFIGGADVTGVESSDGRTVLRYEVDGRPGEVEGDALLVAVGRTPIVDLDLDRAGVDHDREGVKVDDRLRTSNRRVYAVGDVASPYKFTHAADAQARLAVRNALFLGRGRMSRLVIPWATYTSPELARVGMSPAEADDEGIEVESVTVPLSEVDRARLDGDTDGFVRMHLRAGSDEIVGATIVSAHAGELISQVTQAMTRGVGLKEFSDVVFPYPTTAEALRKAADQRRRDQLTPFVERAFGVFFRIWRRFV